MFNNDTIFGIPDYLEKVKEEAFTLNTDNESISNVSEIIKILENTDLGELDKIQIKYEIDDDIIYTYKLKKDKLLLEYISEKNYKEIYNRLEDLEVIPKYNLYENAYHKILKIGKEPEVKPQSVVFAVPVAVYIIGVHSIFVAVNGSLAVNLGYYFNIKSDVNGYSIKKIHSETQKFFPKISPLIDILEESLYPLEQEQLINYIFNTFTKNIISEVKNKKIIKNLNGNLLYS